MRAWSARAAGVVFLLASLAGAASSGDPAGAALLRVGTSGDYPPFSLTDAENDWSGLDADLARRFAADTAAQLEVVLFRWPDLLAEVHAGAFDVAMSGVTMRPERALAGRYVRPYARTGAVLLVRAPEAARFADAAAADRPGVRLVVNAGGHLENLARARFRQASVLAVGDNRSLPERVLAGEADAAVSDSAEARSWLARGLRAVGPFRTDYKAFLLPAENAALARALDDWLVAREGDGWLAERRRERLGEDLEAAGASRMAVAAFVRLRLEMMPAVAAAKEKARLPIEDAAQEARVLDRVRARAARPDLVARVYRELVLAAKDVQRAKLPSDFAAPLAELRDAIARIDEQLVREIDRAPRSDRAEWRRVLAPALADLPLGTERLGALAAALAGG